jgi:4'-phosphopantetheinyl transferase
VTLRDELSPGVVHVWRIPLGDAREVGELRPLLSDAERARADRFYAELHRVRYTIAHGWLRRILARYVGAGAETLRFGAEPKGKPFLHEPAREAVHFNLAHSADLAVVAVSGCGAVGVDVEEWDDGVEHLHLAERFFSVAERATLRGLAPDSDAVAAGFFAAWTRKEAYLKATGHGITRGLHHFDVTLAPGEPARLLDDRLDPDALDRWAMTAFDVSGRGDFSGAVVATAPLHTVTLFDVPDRLVHSHQI